jgi:hypothetical protein
LRADIFDILSRVSAPEIEPNGGGPYSGHVLVTLQGFTAGSEIRYTLDSSEPTKQSDLYVGAFTLNFIGSTTVKAMATKDGLATSDVVSATFHILEQVKKPTFDPNFGTFVDTLTVHISCETEGAKIRCACVIVCTCACVCV